MIIIQTYNWGEREVVAGEVGWGGVGDGEQGGGYGGWGGGELLFRLMCRVRFLFIVHAILHMLCICLHIFKFHISGNRFPRRGNCALEELLFVIDVILAETISTQNTQSTCQYDLICFLHICLWSFTYSYICVHVYTYFAIRLHISVICYIIILAIQYKPISIHTIP